MWGLRRQGIPYFWCSWRTLWRGLSIVLGLHERNAARTSGFVGLNSWKVGSKLHYNCTFLSAKLAVRSIKNIHFEYKLLALTAIGPIAQLGRLFHTVGAATENVCLATRYSRDLNSQKHMAIWRCNIFATCRSQSLRLKLNKNNQ